MEKYIVKKFKRRGANKEVLAAYGSEIIGEWELTGKLLFGHEITYTGNKTEGEYIPYLDKYIPSYKIYKIGNCEFTINDMLFFYENGEISKLPIECFKEEFIVIPEDMLVTDKGYLKISDETYIKLESMILVNIHEDEIIIGHSTIRTIITRENKSFDRIKAIILAYIGIRH